MAKYAAYCTCFYDQESSSVIYWNEITDSKINSKKVKYKEEAKKVMLAYVEEAPPNVICQALW
jgi:hypothetical protein